MNPYHSFGSKENYPKNYSSKSLPQKIYLTKKLRSQRYLAQIRNPYNMYIYKYK